MMERLTIDNHETGINYVPADEALMQELQGHLRYWVRQLRLDHIEFILRWYAPHEADGEQEGSSCAARYHRGLILLRHPQERSAERNQRFRLDYEVIIVHELIHIKESPWRDNPTVEKVMDEDEWVRRLHEDSLDAIAEALVRARRGAERPTL